MPHSPSSRSHHRALLLPLALSALTLAVIEFRRRAMLRNEAEFRAQYDSAGSR